MTFYLINILSISSVTFFFSNPKYYNNCLTVTNIFNSFQTVLNTVGVQWNNNRPVSELLFSSKITLFIVYYYIFNTFGIKK